MYPSQPTYLMSVGYNSTVYTSVRFQRAATMALAPWATTVTTVEVLEMTCVELSMTSISDGMNAKINMMIRATFRFTLKKYCIIYMYTKAQVRDDWSSWVALCASRHRRD